MYDYLRAIFDANVYAFKWLKEKIYGYLTRHSKQITKTYQR